MPFTQQGLSYTVPPSFRDFFGTEDNYFKPFSPFDLTGAMGEWAKGKNLEKKLAEVQNLIRYLEAMWNFMASMNR
ncbi:MAG: hypothetical protein QXN56_01350 [Candidatus Hadarchaeum sp.]